MKKTIFALAGIMLFVTAAQAALVEGPTIDFPITVTINAGIWLEADIDASMLSFYNQVENTNTFSNGEFFLGGWPRATVTSRGGAQVDLTAIVAVTGGMALGTTIGDVGEDQGVLAGIWTYYDDATNDPVNGIDMVALKFQDNDVLSTTVSRVATTTDHFDEVTPDPLQQNGQDLPGYGVGVGTTRTMRFMLQTPNPVNAIRGVEQTLTVTIGAQL